MDATCLVQVPALPLLPTSCSEDIQATENPDNLLPIESVLAESHAGYLYSVKMANTIQMPQTPSSGLPTGQMQWPPLPTVDEDESLAVVVRETSQYFVDVIDAPHTFEQLRTSAGSSLRPLIKSLSEKCHHSGIICALLILKSYFASFDNDDRGINEARGYACEYVAWRFLTHLSERELIEYLLYELPQPAHGSENTVDANIDSAATSSSHSRHRDEEEADEADNLLWSRRHQAPDTQQLSAKGVQARMPQLAAPAEEEDPTLAFVGLNALEIAAVADAKKFLSQRVVQKLVDGVWSGRIIFWDSLSLHTKKKAQVYQDRYVAV